MPQIILMRAIRLAHLRPLRSSCRWAVTPAFPLFIDCKRRAAIRRTEPTFRSAPTTGHLDQPGFPTITRYRLSLTDNSLTWTPMTIGLSSFAGSTVQFVICSLPNDQRTTTDSVGRSTTWPLQVQILLIPILYRQCRRCVDVIDYDARSRLGLAGQYPRSIARTVRAQRYVSGEQ